MSPLSLAWFVGHGWAGALSLLAVFFLVAFGVAWCAAALTRKAITWGRCRAARQVLSARELRRQRLGTHLSDAMERVVEQRVTETHEPHRPSIGNLVRRWVSLDLAKSDLTEAEQEWRAKHRLECLACRDYGPELCEDLNPEIKRALDAIREPAIAEAEALAKAAEEQKRVDEMVAERFWTPEQLASAKGGVVILGPGEWPAPTTFATTSSTTNLTFTAPLSSEPTSHPLGWTLVRAAGVLCGVSPSNDVDYYNLPTLAWMRAARRGFVASEALAALGRST